MQEQSIQEMDCTWQQQETIHDEMVVNSNEEAVVSCDAESCVNNNLDRQQTNKPSHLTTILQFVTKAMQRVQLKNQGHAQKIKAFMSKNKAVSCSPIIEEQSASYSMLQEEMDKQYKQTHRTNKQQSMKYNKNEGKTRSRTTGSIKKIKSEPSETIRKIIPFVSKQKLILQKEKLHKQVEQLKKSMKMYRHNKLETSRTDIPLKDKKQKPIIDSAKLAKYEAYNIKDLAKKYNLIKNADDPTKIKRKITEPPIEFYQYKQQPKYKKLTQIENLDPPLIRPMRVRSGFRPTLPSGGELNKRIKQFVSRDQKIQPSADLILALKKDTKQQSQSRKKLLKDTNVQSIIKNLINSESYRGGLELPVVKQSEARTAQRIP